MFAALRAEQIPFDTAAAGCSTVASGAAIQSQGFGQTVLQIGGGAVKLAQSYAHTSESDSGSDSGEAGGGQGGKGVVAGLALGLVGIGITVFGAIFAHHKKQVARERQVLCAAVPAANETLRVIETAIQQGQIAPAQAIAYLDDLFNQFQGAIGAILKSDSTHCNAACVWRYSLAAIVARKKDRYAHITVKASGARSAADRCQAWLEAGVPVLNQFGQRSPCSTEGPPPLPADDWATWGRGKIGVPTTDAPQRPAPPARAPANQGGPVAAALAFGGAAWWLLF